MALIATENDIAVVAIKAVKDDDAKKDTASLDPVLYRDEEGSDRSVGMTGSVIELRQAERNPKATIRYVHYLRHLQFIIERREREEREKRE